MTVPPHLGIDCSWISSVSQRMLCCSLAPRAAGAAAAAAAAETSSVGGAGREVQLGRD